MAAQGVHLLDRRRQRRGAALRQLEGHLPRAEGRRPAGSGRSRSTSCARRSLTNLRMDPFERAEEENAMGYQRWYMDRMFLIAPAGAYVGAVAAELQGVPAAPEAGQLQPRPRDGSGHKREPGQPVGPASSSLLQDLSTAPVSQRVLFSFGVQHGPCRPGRSAGTSIRMCGARCAARLTRLGVPGLRRTTSCCAAPGTTGWGGPGTTERGFAATGRRGGALVGRRQMCII